MSQSVTDITSSTSRAGAEQPIVNVMSLKPLHGVWLCGVAGIVMLAVAIGTAIQPPAPLGTPGFITQINTALQAPRTLPPAPPPAMTEPLSPGFFGNTPASGVAQPPETTSAWRTVEIQRGDQLSHVFNKVGVGMEQLVRILALGKDAAALTKLYPGDILRFKIGAEGQLEELLYDVDPTRTVRVSQSGESFTVNTVKYPIEKRVLRSEGRIGSSLFQAAQQVGLSMPLTLQLSKIFGFDIDFALDLRRGDKFVVLYEEMFARGRKVGDPKILAAEFVNGDKTYQAVGYQGEGGKIEYYTPEGAPLRKSFLRTPVDFARISSGFSLGRLHPVLNTIRAHRGVDYAAPTGTPIRAAGAGKVSFVGNRAGYGRVVILDHGRGTTTLYAHMSRFAQIRLGDRVAQGELIGYVGQSGLATGPHLHYEFRVNNEHRNPLTVSLPMANRLAGSERKAFMQHARELLAKLQGRFVVANVSAATVSNTR